MVSPVEKKPKFKAAIDGLIFALKEDKSLQLMLTITSLVFIGSLILNIEFTEIMLMMCLSLVVMAFELMNSAIEHLANVVMPKQDKRIEILKDISAGAVLVVSIGALFIGVAILVKYLGGR